MSRKTISLPLVPHVDLQPILAIINSRLFRRLQYVKQLGTGYVAYVSAQHTRFEHSLGAYAIMLQRTACWRAEGLITEEEAINLCLLALLHDIGHGPYSHATEIFYPTDHNKNGLRIIHELTSEIEACGGNMYLLLSLFERKHPLAFANCHCPLGADKLDYLRRDAFYTANSTSFRLSDLINHVHFLNGQMAVNIKFLDQVKQLQNDYVNMHKNVYFMQACIIAQYFLQQIVARAIASGDVSQGKLPFMTDRELDSALTRADDPDVRSMFDRLLYRDLPKTAVVLRAQEALTPYSHKDKAVQLFRVPLSHLEKFSIFDQREIAATHEFEIAKIAGVSPEEVLVTPIASPHRFIPADVHVYDSSQIVGTLKEFFPGHYNNLEETTTDYAAVRVCVSEEHRKKVAQRRIAREIYKYLMQLV